MEKLTIEQLAHYLPYELKIHWLNIDGGDVVAVMDIDGSENCSLSILDVIDFGYKPVLRPLSDIILSGYHFIYSQETDAGSINQWLYLDNESKIAEKFSYIFWQLLFENHFDVFGLIEKGLAIDINTL